MIRFSLTLRRHLLATCLLILGLTVSAPGVRGQDPTPPKLVVGTKEAPPFSFRSEDGRWSGISIDLWQSIAGELELDYELRELSLVELVQGLEDGSIDLGVAALTVTPERQATIDFSHPLLPSGLGIAVPVEDDHPLGPFRGIVSVEFLRAAGTLTLLVLLAGLVIWILERRRNPQFGGNTAQGIGSGFWWSAVTMTTVGYGDKSPQTAAGRSVAVVWMFASVIMISGLTAAIASTLTLSRLEHSVDGPQDLPDLGRIATVQGSTSEDYLRGRRLAYQSFESPALAMQAVADGKLRAAVYDEPILRYLVETEFREGIAIVPTIFERQSYAFGLPVGSPLRRDINRALVERLSGEEWESTLYRYLGSEN